MGILQAAIEKHQKTVQERNDKCESLICQIDKAVQEAKQIFDVKDTFIEPKCAYHWKAQNDSLLNTIQQKNIAEFKKAAKYKTLSSLKTELLEEVESLPEKIAYHNETVAQKMIPKAYEIVGDVEGRKLDKQQMACIVKEVDNHLVIAGAGTGKTTTIVGKIKYLLKTNQCKPEDILVLSFTNASATEMNERIAAETGEKIDASTFHKLGLNIISKVNGVMPKITQVNLRRFIKEQMLLNMKSPKYLGLLCSYLLYNRVPAKSEFEFDTKKEYDEYLALNPPITIRNEHVKSYGEMDIANFLLQNGIPYVYEQSYEIDTRTSEYSQYYPDFYLPEHNIYIEYFGINRKGEVPPYFKGKGALTATEAYRSSMEWKRTLHQENQTKMIECFAYEKLEGNLLKELKVKLKDAGVALSPKSSDELWQQVTAEGESSLDTVVELFETMINLIKSNRYDIEKVRELNKGGSNVKNNRLLLALLEPIFNAYAKHLTDHNEIDFNDMINIASDYIKSGEYVNPYKYVIVDEYQDISKARFQLLKNLRESSDYKLFCVGDDWQSIYRFAGSDIGFILHFEDYWGATAISRIETTYRFTQKLIEISGDFIMQNPAQIKKSIQGKSDEFGFPLGEISGYTDKFAVEFMAKKLNDLPKGSSVFFIGRYTFDAKLLNDSGIFKCQYDNTKGVIGVTLKSRPDLQMSFITAHKSKGLQADYVFIINNRKSRMGFPSKIQDAPILNLLLENCDQYPHAEERRLFYVALTRAKKKAFLMTVTGQESEFALEIKEKYGDELKKEQFQCPLCGGKLLKKSGPYGEFFGCSNYQTNGCQYKRKIR